MILIKKILESSERPLSLNRVPKCTDREVWFMCPGGIRGIEHPGLMLVLW